jgi:hypothetical protein
MSDEFDVIIRETHHKLCIKTLQRIALIADTESAAHHEEFETYYRNYDKPNGWRVAERMREIANDVVGNLPIEENLQIYKRAMESMAAQFIHPRMTARELAELQLKEKGDGQHKRANSGFAG